MRHGVRWILLILVATALFLAALSGEVYNATSPEHASWHLLARKGYSVGAFTLVGALFAFARNPRRGEVLVAVAIYSGCIEVGQWFVADEPLGFNVLDVACGALGGALGEALLRFATRFARDQPQKPPGIE